MKWPWATIEKGKKEAKEMGENKNVYRIYAPVNDFNLVGTLDFGIYSGREIARDRLLRLSAEMADQGFKITWTSKDGDGFHAYRRGYSVRVRIEPYLLDEFRTKDMTEQIIKNFHLMGGAA